MVPDRQTLSPATDWDWDSVVERVRQDLIELSKAANAR